MAELTDSMQSAELGGRRGKESGGSRGTPPRLSSKFGDFSFFLKLFHKNLMSGFCRILLKLVIFVLILTNISKNFKIYFRVHQHL